MSCKWQRWLPDVLVAVWLLFLGITIWQHTLHSAQPPLYDPLGYMLKAKHFWEAVGQGKPFNPMNLDPVSRPPGTVLMTYPFGFSDNFLGFHFRSVFLPILCVVMAVYIVAGATKSVANAGWAAAIAVLFSTLPMFYHLDLIDETGGPVRWGLVDNFQAGVAAMAAAAAVRSTIKKSQAWLLFAISLAAFTLLIKPSGLMVMALLALAWLVIVAFEWIRASRLQNPDRQLLPYALKGTAVFLFVYGFMIYLCVFSEYFSEEMFAYAKQSLVVMAEMLQASFDVFLIIFHKSSGEALPLWAIGVASFFSYRIVRNKKPITQLQAIVLACLANSLIIWGLGAWYWLVVQSGGNQIRYFYPFMLMGGICVVPAAIEIWRQTHRMVRYVFLALCLVPAFNIAALLEAGDSPSIYWQNQTGVSLSVGVHKEIISQAYAFLDNIRKTGKNAKIYTVCNDSVTAIFDNVGLYENMFRQDLPSFKVQNTTDWQKGFAVRVNDLLGSDYLLTRVDGTQYPQDLLKAKQFDSIELEREAFEVFLSTLDERSGVKIYSEGRSIRLLRIVDPSALNHAIEEFVSAHAWRPEFVEANKPVWWNADEVSAYTKKLAEDEIDFGGVYKLHALLITSVPKGIKIEVWWEGLQQEKANSQHMLFLHLVDSSGNTILQNKQIFLYPYAPFAATRKWRHDEVNFDLQPSDERVASLAFGVYQVDGQFLLANKGQTDWGGKRVLIPLKPFLHPEVAKASSVPR